ncbi:DHA3 family tetracycline resistance protein-like MFS transporter [Mycobacterium frederiksbergense]|uniref:DHA3 family tetracycline resistance protein-like MFS transporter n=2 Tax=Mycolicibacterium frederiksbergense TaxID=117567 RepID=A0ABT6L611_9MYCO|nr:DHA3 family tetracycline resistance protein-like MFS transporter [Mycolicibacterium frederiksbergense]
MSMQPDVGQPTQAVQQPGGWRVLAPFRIREYRLLIAAMTLSIFAEGMWSVVMALQVIAIDNDPASLSLVTACLGVGLVMFVLIGGIAADRINQRAIIIAVEAVNLMTVSTIAVLGLLDAVKVWHLAVAAAILGIAAAFFFPAYSAMLPRILPPEQLLAANGVEGVVRPVFQRSVGPAVAGMVIAATFPSLGAVVVAMLFGLGLVLLVATRPTTDSAEAQDDSARPHVLRDLRDGFAFMLHTPWLLWTLLFASLFVLVVLGPIEVLVPFIAQDRFADGARAYGFILAFYGFGSALGALTVSSRRMPRRYLTTMMLLWGLGSIPLVIVGITSSFPLMAAATFAIGVTDGAAVVIWGTLLQRRVPTEMLGRVSSLDFFVSLAFMPLSFAIVGPLSKVVPMQTIFLVAGLTPALLAAVAVAAARMPRDELAHPLR